MKDSINEGLFYTGEQWDNSAEQYYLRARYYDPLTGRFNRMDPFAGNNQDPQSLHKYLYAHCNPVNNIDPSGEFGIGIAITLVLSIGAFRSAFALRKGLHIVDMAARLSGTPLSYESISDLARLWAVMVIQLSQWQLSYVASSTQIIFEMAVMYTIDMALLALTAGLQLAMIGLSTPTGTGGTQTISRLTAKAKRGAQSHHLLSGRIIRALNAHPRLAGLFRGANPRMIFRAASQAAHRGYQLWHRSVDDIIVNWLRNNPKAGRKDFLLFLRRIYQSPGISARIPKVFLSNL